MRRQHQLRASCFSTLSALLAATLLPTACNSQAPAQKLEGLPVVVESKSQAVVEAGFSDTIAFSGRTNPIAVRFASNGKVFVAEEAGRIYFYDNLSDTTATLFADLRDEVNSYWDRGMLGFTLDPNFATNGYVYILYNHDTATNAENNQSSANRNATDNCPSPPGGTSQGCVTYGRLSRLQDTGTYPVNFNSRTDLITEWPEQFPSHAIGGLAFGPDGMLYATGGDGASFGAQDYGNFGIPKNPLGDPPAGVGGTMTSPTSRGGSLRSQSFRRPAGENVVLNGTVIRINPSTGAGATGNPNLSHTDVDARRIIAYGLRNPYRFTFHPTTGDIWIADVGGNAYEEIDRLPAPLTATPMKNFGWPCYEGPNTNSAWTGFNLCSGVTHAAPYYSYAHDALTYSTDKCTTVGSSAITGIAFYPPTGAGNYPTTYRNAMFYADLPRRCIWVMTPNADGTPNVASRKTFISDAANPVDLQIGPNNDLFYVDYGGTGGQTTNAGTGTVRRVRYQAPTAVATANPTSGFTPLAVQFTGSMSTPGISGDTLSYAWDLDGDGQYDDSTAQNPSRTYNTPGTISVRLKVTDQRGGFGESQPISIVAGSTTTPPEPVMDTPVTGLTWKVGDTISFSGHATDVEDGTIPASGLTWNVIMEHCPNTCHEHLVQTFEGVASGSFPAPDHEYPSYLQLRLTATDSHGRTTTVTRDLQPQTVVLSFATVPSPTPGIVLGLNLDTFTAPFTRTVIKGSFNSLTANNQTIGANQYSFQSWSDGGAQAHDITANADASFTATFGVSVNPWTSAAIGTISAPGSWSESGGVHTISAGGADIWNAADAFRFTYQQLSGDGSITARVTSFPNSANNANGKAGVMIRQNLNANSPHAMAAMPPSGTTTLVKQIKRLTAGATSTSESGPSATFPGWVRVTRAGTTLTAWYSTDGVSFTQLGTATTISTLTGAVYVGLAVTSHVDATAATAMFDNVVITTPAPPQQPSTLVATGGVNQVQLSWVDNSNNETGFKIERKPAASPDSSFAQIGTTGANSAAFTNTGLAPGDYSFRVRSTNANGDSAYTNTATATVTSPPPPNAPSGLTVNGGVSQAQLAWSDNADNETGFKVERKLAADPDTSFAQIGTTNTNVTSYTDSGVPGGVYSYRVRATNAVGDSGYSNSSDATITDPPPPAAPSGLMVTGGVGQAALSWTDNANNETGFKIERRLTSDLDDAFAQIATVGANVTSYVNSGVAGGNYTYRVRATNTVGDSPFSNTASGVVTDPTVPNAPSNLTATGASAQASLSWTDNASDETGFKIERKLAADPDTSFAQVGTTGANATTFTNTGLAAGTYSFRVRATNAVGDSAYSNAADATVTAAQVSPFTSQDIGAITLPAGTYSFNNGVHTVAGGGADIWTAADEFRYAYQQLSGDGTITARVTSFTNVGNANGKAGVMMRQNLNANSPHVMTALPPSGTTTVNKLIKRLTAGATSTAESSTTSALPTWVRLVRAGTTFTAYTSTDGNTFTQVGTATTISTMTGTIYVGLAVTSHVDGTNATAVFDNVTVTGPPPPTAPAAPSGLAATGGSGQVALSWVDNANNETGFKVERKLSSGADSTYTQIATPATNATTYTNTGLAAGSYSFRVRATNAVGDSAYSNVATATVTVASGPAAPSNLNATTATGNSAILTWTDNASNETGFRVERKVGTGSYASLTTKGANVVTHTDTGLAAGTYTYRVIATGSSDSTASNEVVVVINNPVADAYVRDGVNAGTNYGTEALLKIKQNTSPVDNNRRSFVRFSLSGVAATVTSAKLRLYGVATTNPKTIGAHAVSNITWGETTITSSNAPTYTTPAITSASITTTAAYVEWDITSYVQAQRTANASAISLALVSATIAPDAETNINSKENTANKPILIISSK